MVIFTGDDALSRSKQVLEMLPWSEGYSVEIRDDVIVLEFIGSTEDIDAAEAVALSGRKLQELLRTGELISILE